MVNTYNRRAELERVLRSVLRQRHDDFEVVVADDGSEDGTREYMESRVAEPTPVPLDYVRQPNAGLSAARNLGASASGAEYLVWLDDDDDVDPAWLETFDRAAADAGDDAAVLCVGARLVDPGGAVSGLRRPAPLGPAFAGQTGLFLAGTFAVRRDAFVAVGGYTEALRCSHQTELALRLLPRCVEEGWAVGHRPETVLLQRLAPPGQRARNDPRRLLECTEWLLEHHGARLRLDPDLYASYEAIAGVAAARTDDFPRARAHLAAALRTRPLTPRAWGRLAAAGVPAIGRRVWGGAAQAGAAPP